MNREPAGAPQPHVYGVSELTRQVRGLLEHQFPVVTVEGELSNLSRPRSGHWYFTLKDDRAQLRCAMFRGDNRRVRFDPEEGRKLQVRGRLSLYEGRGDFQLIADRMTPAGEGALRAAFEALREKLAGEGLFLEDRKRPLPAWPRTIAVVASATSAALRDVRSVVSRRFPALALLEFHSSVQGAASVPELLEAVAAAGASGADVILLVRGGGSLEDLWSFNDERLARALAALPVPVVTGVGHETDFTIADFVADRRAPTPSAAAELATPDAAAAAARFRQIGHLLARLMRARMQRDAQDLDHRLARLRAAGPQARLDRLLARTERLRDRLERAQALRIARERRRVDGLRDRLFRAGAPELRLSRARARLEAIRDRLGRGLPDRVVELRRRTTQAMRLLHGVSPLATLERGYAIVTRPEDGSRFGAPLERAADARVGEAVEALFDRGRLVLEVREVDPHRRP